MPVRHACARVFAITINQYIDGDIIRSSQMMDGGGLEFFFFHFVSLSRLQEGRERRITVLIQNDSTGDVAAIVRDAYRAEGRREPIRFTCYCISSELIKTIFVGQFVCALGRHQLLLG